jgi:hypothetical protein
MFTITGRGSLLSLLVLMLGGTGLARAQEADPLDRVRKLREIEAQRVEKEFREGREYAYRVVRTEPTRAFDRIQSLLDIVAADEALDASRRDQLTRTLKRDVSLLRGILADRKARNDESTARAAARVESRRTEDPRRTNDARSAVDAARSRIESMNSRVTDARSTRAQTNDRYLATQAQVDASAKPPASDYELPADWVEKSKRRSPEQKLTAREKALLDALQKPISVDFSGDTFSSVIEYLQKLTGQTIVMDKQALEEANVTYDTPVTLRLPKVSLRTVLKRMLGDLNLTYVIKEESIQITTPARAKEMMVTRAYYVGDLVGMANVFYGPALNQLQMIQSIGTIINTVQSQIDPATWQANGGSATIVYDPISMSLIIKASAEVHYMLGGGH